MKDKQMSNYLKKIFISYFLAISLPIIVLATVVINLTISTLENEQINQLQNEISSDILNLNEFNNSINTFTYTVLVNNTSLHKTQKGIYEDNVYHYSVVMEMLKSFEIGNKFTVSTSIYTQYSDKVFSTELGVLNSEDYKSYNYIEKMLEDEVSYSHYVDGDYLIFLLAFSELYFSDDVVLTCYAKPKEIFSDFGLDNLVIVSASGDILFSGDEIDYQDLTIDKLSGNQISIEDSNLTLVYRTDENTGLTIGRMYDNSIVNEIVFSFIVSALIVLLLSLSVASVVAFGLAKIQCAPVEKLSHYVMQNKNSYSGNGVFQNIEDFLDNLKKENSNYKNILDNGIELMQDSAIRNFVLGSIPPPFTHDEYLANVGIEDLPKSFVPVLVYTGNNMLTGNQNNAAQMNLVVKDLVKENFADKFTIVGSTTFQFNQIFFILNADEEFSFETLSKVFEELIDLLMKKLSLGIRVVIGNKMSDTSELSSCYVQMKKEMINTSGMMGKILLLSPEQRVEEFNTEKLIVNLSKAITLGKPDDVKTLFDYMINLENEDNSNEFSGLIYSVTVETISSLSDYSEIVDGVGLNLLKLISSDNSTEKKYLEIIKLLDEITLKFSEYINQSDDNIHVNSAIEYIKAHLNEDISIEDIANQVGLNPSYLSRIFKTTTDITPLKYITDLRMEQAKSMLIHSNLSVKEISESLGYNDTRSFIRFFKKYEDCTPNVFREKHQSNQIGKD